MYQHKIVFCILFLFPNALLASDYTSYIKNIYDCYRLMDSFTIYTNYAKKVSESDLKSIPPPPLRTIGGGSVLEKYIKVEKNIKDFKLPDSIEIPQKPTLNDFLYNNNDKRRKTLNNTVKWVKILDSRREELIQIIKALEKNIQLANVTYTAADKIGDSFFELYEKIPHYTLANVFGFSAIDIKYTFIPQIIKIKDSLEEKNKIFLNYKINHESELKNSLSNIQIALYAENEALEKILEKYKDSTSISQRLKHLSDHLDVINKNESIIKNKRQSLKKKYFNIKAKKSAFKKTIYKIQDVNNKITTIKKFIKSRPYNLCPNKKNYNDCNHSSLKFKWLNSINTKKEKLKYLTKKREKLLNSEKTIKSSIKNYSINYMKNYKDLKEEITLNKSKKNKIEKEIQLLKKDFFHSESILSLKSENEYDFAEVNNLIEKYKQPPQINE